MEIVGVDDGLSLATVIGKISILLIGGMLPKDTNVLRSHKHTDFLDFLVRKDSG